MPFKVVLGNLEQKIIFVAQPWWGTFRISYVGFFSVGKLTNHF